MELLVGVQNETIFSFSMVSNKTLWSFTLVNCEQKFNKSPDCKSVKEN